MSTDQFTLDYYKKVANNFGTSPLSSMQDQYIRQSEIEFFLGEIARFIQTKEYFPRILDAGCGNGYLLEVVSLNFPQCPLWGLEYTPELYKIAKNRQIPKCHMIQGDLRKGTDFPAKVDIVITERSVINLRQWREQRIALSHIAQTLQQGGLYLMSESFMEPWMELNRARKQMALEPVAQSPQNLYLTENVVNHLKSMGLSEIPGVLPKNYLSTHFYTSRVDHRFIKPGGGRIKESEYSRFFDRALNSAAGNYSPILMRAFEKVSL